MSSDTVIEEASGGTSEKSAAADQELVGRFMEMLSAEKGAAENTRQAYARDLDDFLPHPFRQLTLIGFKFLQDLLIGQVVDIVIRIIGWVIIFVFQSFLNIHCP